MIKTLKEEELKLLVRDGILEKYAMHLEENPDSMLARFYGVFTVKIKNMKPISVVIMDNLMSNKIDEITSIYDLKGSLHRRDTKKITSEMSVRKDLNFLRDKKNVVAMPEQEREEFARKLEKDKELLK
jgi:1-phosphatidylinositol-4-phosphate 5-kinase